MVEDGLEKAKFFVYHENNTETLDVMFNPAEYRISNETGYATTEDVGGTKPEKEKKNYKGTRGMTLSFQLFFDTSASFPFRKLPNPGSDVSVETRKIIALMYPEGELHRPPLVTFYWGSLFFTGNIVRAETAYTFFDADGTPLRAKTDVTMEQDKTEEGKWEEPFLSPDRTKAREVTQFRRVWDIAYEEYGSHLYWKKICVHNRIEDPLRIPAGTLLQLPPDRKEEADD